MADLSSLLAILAHDPDDEQARAALDKAARTATIDVRSPRFAAARKTLSARGRPDAVIALLDAELAIETESQRTADLWLEKAMVLDTELLDVAGARAAYARVLELRPSDELAREAVDELDVAAKNWQKFATKYVHEATASTDRSLATGLYVSAAECYVRFTPEVPEAEAHLRRALEIDSRHAKAAFHLARILATQKRWKELGELYDERGEQAATVEEKVGALLSLYELANGPLANEPRADRAIRRALALDPAHPRALRVLTDVAAAANDWPSVVAMYQAALRARRDDDAGMLLQVAMALWKHVGDQDQAEEYFRRLRKLEPGHPAALEFYRAYYTARGESAKLMALLKSVDKAGPKGTSIGVEIAELAEAQNNPEKAIEAWKQHLRGEPGSLQARAALARLYRKTEKWNALLDLMKDEIERLPDTDVDTRVARQFEIVEIYRDRLKLDVMVINTYNAILKLDPDNTRAADELAAKYRALGRWNDLIAILTRKAESPTVPNGERVRLLREVAELWSERFGNFANAIKPLERIVELAPSDGEAVAKLKEIYTKRRQWRALIDLLGKEASVLAGPERRGKQTEMARLAAERLGDARLAIEIYNVVLGEAADGDAGDVLVALAALYDREKRYLAYVEVLHRQVAVVAKDKARAKEASALYEKLGQVYADRLAAPQQAAAAWQQVLELDPSHTKALRTLRELYALAGDFTGLEALYARLGQEEELVEALLGIADRLDSKARRLPLVERAAQLAQRRAEAAKEAAQPMALEKARQVWERVLAVEQQHIGAAVALAPIYAKQEKWTRLLAVYEIELTALASTAARLAKMMQIQQLCEQRLASKNLAFGWALRAFEVDPVSDALFADVIRLASEPDHWREVTTVFERVFATGISDKTRLKLLRELARIANKRLGDPDRARSYHRQVLKLAPEDLDAESQLEELATMLADWPELLASYRRRAAREHDPPAKAQLLVEIAELQEQQLVDLDGAAQTYREALAAVQAYSPALRALARIEEARGDWESLHDVLAQELTQIAAGQAKFELLMRLGALAEHHLDRPAKALVYYEQAFGVPAVGGGVRPQPIDAIARLVLPAASGTRLDPKDRAAAVRTILPQLERMRSVAQQAAALEVLRASNDTSASEKTDHDRALMRLYHVDLGDPAAAWQTGLRVLAADPADGEVRAALAVLAGQLGRDGEWAEQLTAALAALRAQPAVPAQVRVVATELAKLTGERLGDRAAAERAWLVVLELEHDATDAFDALTISYRADERWTDLRALLERRAEVTVDQRQRLASLLAAAILEQDILEDAARAAVAYRRVLELEPGCAIAYDSLDRIYSAAGQWRDLEELLARRVDHERDTGRIYELTLRRATLFAHLLGEPTRAVDLLEDVLARARHHDDARELLEELLTDPKASAVTMRVARLLEPLYEDDHLWKDLVGVLRVQRGLVTGTEAVETLARIANIEETELGGARNAFDCWLEVLRLEPAHERARVELARLAQWLGRWPEATAALEAAVTALPDADRTSRAALLGELATYYDLQLGDAPRAIAAYRRLLETDPTSPATLRRACGALARLYEDQGDYRALRDITRMQAAHADDADEKRALLAHVAALEEDQLGDRATAIQTWAELLVDQPADAGALHALERLYQQAASWRPLIDVLRRRVDVAADDHEAIELLGRIAEIHERRLSEHEDAIAAWLEIIDRESDSPRALAELARLYRGAQRHADLLDVLERQATAADGPERLGLEVAIAELLQGPLHHPVDALERWANVLRVEPQHMVALAAIEAALGDVDLRQTAADILRPVYEATAQEARLAKLALHQADWADDPAGKLRALGEVVRLREHRLGDKAGAFEAQLQALRFAATEQELPRVVAETERLAGELGRQAELIDAYRELAPSVLDAEIQRRLYLDTADLARAVRHDIDLARDYYQKVLDLAPEDRRALVALESIYRERDDDDHLVEILLRQASADSSNVDDRVGALVEAAQIYTNLKRPDDAIGTWEQVLGSAPERGDAIYALEALYSSQGRWHDVVDLYERRLGFVTSMDEAVALRVQLGEIHEKQLHDIEAAVENYAAALGGNQKQPAALDALERLLADPDARASAAEVLEPVYVGQQRWHDLIRVYEAKLEAAAEPADRLRLTRFVARLYEEQLEDFEHASQWYAKVFRESPTDDSVRDQLQRLASIVDNWAFVAETYQHYLDDETGETAEVRDVAIAAATIYDRRLGDADRAYAAYRRALAIDDPTVVPDARELVRRIEELLARARKWPELLATYDELVTRSDDDLRRDALVRRARLLEDGLADQPRAIEAWREVVLACDDASDPPSVQAYTLAVTELERLYRQRTMWLELVELYEARLSHGNAPLEVAELRLRLADVLETELKDIPGALDQHEHVLQADLGWERAVGALERLVVHDEHRERVIDLLEPVYRREDWWQKLVVVLDAKLEYIRDPIEQVAVLHEIADIHEERGGAIDLALTALARAWRIDVVDDAALTKLLSLAGRLGAWDEAVRTVEDGAAGAPNGELAAGLWARAAEIHEAERGDLPHAIAAWRKVEEARGDDLVALAALDRLLAHEGLVDELVKVVERRAELTDDAGVRLVLLHRVAALYEEVLADKANAIGAYKNVLAVDDADDAALDALERLYRAPEVGNARELALVLERKIELATAVPARQALRRAAAEVYERDLRDEFQAIAQLTSLLDDDGSDAAALAALDRIYTAQKAWSELLDVIDRRTLLAVSTRERAELAFRGARLVELELTDIDAAIPRYGTVLQISAAHDGARAALEALMAKDEHVETVTPILERVYRAEREAAGLIRVYERRLAAVRDPSSRRADWQALADVREKLANQPAQAFVVWGRALADEPDHVDLLVPLVRLAESQSLWRELAALLDERLDDSAQPLPADTEQLYATRLGEVAEQRLGDLERAARAFDRASHGPEPRPALAALERVLARGTRWKELASVLRRQADSAPSDAESVDYLYRLGELQESTLHDAAAAIAVYRDLLAIDASHPAGRSALERILRTSPEHGEAIVEILEPLYEQDGDAGKLAVALEARFTVAIDPHDRAEILARLVILCEQQLGDRARALDAALRWLAIDPASQQALAESGRLADQLGQWRETATRVDAIVRAVDANARPPDVQVGLLVFLGRILRTKLGNFDAATATYRAALALEPDSLAALDPLVEILRERGDHAGLAEALRQRAAVVQELPEKRAALAEVAGLCERAGDRAGAISAWREVADHDDTDRDALDQLARLHRAAGERSELVDVLTRAARLAANASDEKQLRVEIAELEADGERAVAAWQAVLDLDPDDGATLVALERAHTRAGDWIAVGDVQSRRLDLAKTTRDKVLIHADMARVAETKRQSLDDAIAAWYAALDLDGGYGPAYDELERVLTAAQRWHDLVELLGRHAELYASLGDGAAEIQALARAADVWEAKLDNPEAAGEILEKILARAPGSVAALTRLSKLYERAGDLDKCKQALEQALRLGPEGRDAADLFYRLGEVARVGDREDDTAVQHFQHVLRFDANHGPAIAALEKLARDRRDSALLVDMLQRRALVATVADERVALYVELAKLERKAGHPDAALGALAKAAEDARDDVRVLGPLADLYFLAGRHDEAAPIYDRLAQEAKAARRMKDVARFRARQGAILDARGDRPGALAAYEEALRVNPTDIVTMTGLGRLYFAMADWEKARKIYQSLVLQNIDSDAGVTKGEVYWTLGKIHIELGQSPKAKSMFQRGLEIEPTNAKLREALGSLS